MTCASNVSRALKLAAAVSACLQLGLSHAAVVSSVLATGPAETVYDWETQHCADGKQKNHQVPPRPYRRDVPDAPAMAWRDPVSNTTYVAPGDSRGTWASVGHGLSNVVHDCDRMIFNCESAAAPQRSTCRHAHLFLCITPPVPVTQTWLAWPASPPSEGGLSISSYVQLMLMLMLMSPPPQPRTCSHAHA